ncbi:MAG TPA: HDOD domain-containing protein [Candidatus Acidoferrum sp.]|nr:HDOD domain-containing protein [Candidatus Acidoferrum sp.]
MHPDAPASAVAPFPPEETRRLVQRIVDLPTLPIIIPRVLRLVEDRRSSAGDLAKVIGSDQALASRILRLANSAFYGFRREIVSISHAVVLLGFDTVKSIVLAATVMETLGNGDLVSNFDREQFWLHVVTTAAASRIIGRKLRTVDAEGAFVAGLLHDLGKVVLDRFFYRHYAEVARLAVALPCPIREAEMTLFSVDHAQVGSWLVERWRLPPAIIEPVAFHHRPAEASAENWNLSAVVHLADILARNAGIGSGGDSLIPLPDPEILGRLRVKPADLIHWTDALTAEREAVENFLRVLH